MIHLLLLPLALLEPGPRPQETIRTVARESSVVAAPVANPTEHLVRALPEDAILVGAIAPMDEIRLRLAQNAWAEFALEGSWTSFEKLLAMVLDMDRDSRAVLEHIDVEAVLDSIHGPLAWSVSSSPYGWELCTLIDAGKENVAFGAFFNIGWGALEGRERDSATHEYDGASILIANGLGRMHLGLFRDGAIFGALLHEDGDSVLPRIVEIIDHIRGDGDGAGFLATDTYARAKQAHPGLPIARLLFSGTACFEALAKEMNEVQLGRTTEIGVFDIAWGYLNLDLGAGESLDMSSGLSIPKDTLLGDFADLLGPLPVHLLPRLPAESTNISLGSYDVQGAWGLFQDTLAQYSPEGFDELDGWLDTARELWGIDIEEELIAQFTGNIASFTMPVPEEEYATQLASLGFEFDEPWDESNAILIELDDPFAVEGALEKMLLNTGLDSIVEEGEFEDYTYLSADLGAQRLLWSFTDDAMLYSGTPTPMHTALLLSERQTLDKSHLARFRNVLKKYGSEVSLITISDTSSSVEGILAGLAMLEVILPMMEADPALRSLMELDLPDRSLVGSYFEGTLVQTVSRRGNGVYVDLQAR